MDELKRLLEAAYNGVECDFAVSDKLMELGYPQVAIHHNHVGVMNKNCDLTRLVVEKHWRTTLEEYLDRCERLGGAPQNFT